MNGTQTQLWMSQLVRNCTIQTVTDMAILKLDIIIDRIKEIDSEPVST